jgi:capsule polysaccharide export protein KpsE/RkpR
MDKNKDIELNLFKVLKNYIVIIVSIPVIVALITIGIGFCLPKTYETNFRIVPSKESGSNGGSLLNMLSNSAGLAIPGGSSNSQVNLLLELYKSRRLASILLNDSIFIDLKNNKQLNEEVKFNLIKGIFDIKQEKTGYLNITVSYSTDFLPDEKQKIDVIKKVKLIAEKSVKIVDSLINLKNNNNAKRTRIYLDNELQKYYSLVDTVGNKMQGFQEKQNVLDIEAQTKATISQVVDLASELAKLQSDLNIAKIQYTENSPIIKSLSKQIEFTKQQINKIQKGLFLESDDYSLSLDKVPGLTKDYTSLFRNRKIIEQVIVYLETQKHQEAIQEDKRIPNLDLIDEPYEPSSPAKPNVKLMGLSAFLITLFITYLISLVIEYRKQRNAIESIEV